MILNSVTTGFAYPSALPQEVSAHETDVFGRPQLLELLAGRSPVAGQVVDGAGSRPRGPVVLDGEMGAHLLSWFEYHGLRVFRADGSVGKD